MDYPHNGGNKQPLHKKKYFIKRHKRKLKGKVVTHEKFSGATDKLDGHVFQYFSETSYLTQFTSSIKALQVYATNNFQHGSNIKWIIKYMEDFRIPMPSRPTDVDDEFEQEIHKEHAKQYVGRLTKYNSTKQLYTRSYGGIAQKQCNQNYRGN